MNAVDLHFHLLPGVDDGPATVDDSVELAREAAAQGTGTIVATPHVRSDFVQDVGQLPTRVAELRGVLAAEEVPVTVMCGAELGHDMVGRLGQAELETIAQGPPGARWLLVETPFEGIDQGFQAATEELRDRGFSVLLAHPERTADAILDRYAGLAEELAAGSLALLNALSLSGDHGVEAGAAGWALVQQGLAAGVASDAHGWTRPPALLRAEQLLSRQLGPDRARGLVHRAPRRMLARGLFRAAVPAA